MMHRTTRYRIVVSLVLLAHSLSAQSYDWPSFNGELSANRFSPLSEITRGNVANLRPACTYDTGEITSFQSGLLMLRDVI